MTLTFDDGTFLTRQQLEIMYDVSFISKMSSQSENLYEKAIKKMNKARFIKQICQNFYTIHLPK